MNLAPIPRRAPIWIAIFAAAAWVNACGKVASVPPGYTPLDSTNLAKLPAATSSNKYPETLNTVNGHDDSTGYDYADGEGYIDASITQVWAAMQIPDVMVQHRTLTSCQIASTNTNSTADYSYEVNVVGGGVDQFTLAGRELATEGSKADPQEVVFRDDLVASPSGLNQVDSDSVILMPVDSGTTSYAVIRHEQNDLGSTPETNDSDADQYINDIYNAVVAQVHGHAVPFESDSPCKS